MESLFFIATALVCFFVAVLSENNRTLKYKEIDSFQRVLEQLLNIQKYIGHLEKSFQEQQEHTMRCVLYNAVHVSRPLHGIRIEGGRVSFRDVHIIDANSETTEFRINRSKQSCGYRTISGCTDEDRNPLLIELNAPVTFKYISLEQLDCCSNCRVILLMKDNEETVYISQKKHMICNTATFY